MGYINPVAQESVVMLLCLRAPNLHLPETERERTGKL